MREVPPIQIVELLERLGIGTRDTVASVVRRVRRLAGELPHFDSVWIDALAQAHVLTHYQAVEINAGRGDELAIGSKIITERLPARGFTTRYRARDSQSGSQVNLQAVEESDAIRESALNQLKDLVQRSQNLGSLNLRPVVGFEVNSSRVWTVSEEIAGISAADWMIENGRFPPLVALHIARQMVAALIELERHGILHGDLHVCGIMLTRDGLVVLNQPGVRPIVRAIEDQLQAELPIEAYESVAPERLVAGVPHSLATELFACGCVWWQLLTGRPAITGGNAAAKIRSATQAVFPDVRQLAADAPPVLAEVISACLAQDPAKRPQSLMELANLLGPATEVGNAAIAKCVRFPERWLLPEAARTHRRLKANSHLGELAGAAICAAVILSGWWLVRSANAVDSKTSHVSTLKYADAEKPQQPRTLDRNPVTKPRRANRRSPGVVPASFTERSRKRESVDKPATLELPVGRTLDLRELTPQAGQLVRGQDGKRALVRVPHTGLIIEVTDVRFQNVDFVIDEGSEQTATMISVTAAAVEFINCSFNGSNAATNAITWLASSDRANDQWEAAADNIKLKNCVFYRVGAAVDRHRCAEARVEVANSLLIESGPFVRISSTISTAAFSLIFDGCTLRDSGPVVEVVRQSKARGRVGRVCISATDSVFCPAREQPLFKITAKEEPKNIAASLRWEGQGSLVALSAPILGWEAENGEIEPLEESQLQISGLARSQLEFADSPSMDPAASGLKRWLAPRQTAEPPGIVPAELCRLPGGRKAI